MAARQRRDVFEGQRLQADVIADEGQTVKAHHGHQRT